MDDLIPVSKREAVARALAQTFGTRRPDSFERLRGGLSSADVFRVEVGGGRYLLRIERPVDGFNDPVRHYRCLALASEAGVAPRLLYASEAAGIAITDFVETQPLGAYAGGREAFLRELADLVRRTQATATFPPLVDFLDGVDQLIDRLQWLDLVAPSAMAAHLDTYAAVKAACRRGPLALVSSHNDLNPRNVLYDGRRLWLIDWEAAFCNDPFVDIAQVANWFARDEAEAEFLVAAWLDHAPGEAERTHLFLMRQICRVYYAAVLMASAVVPGFVSAAPDMQAPELDAFSAAVGEGRRDLDQPAERLAYGKAMLNRMLDDCRGPRGEAALATAVPPP